MVCRALVLVCVLAGSASAESWKRDRGVFEWSSWIRLGYGVDTIERSTIARGVVPQPRDEQVAGFDAGLGAELTLPIPTPYVRTGPWLELRGAELFGGAELLVARAPRDLRMFFYNGEGVWSLRAGASNTRVTGAIAFGYRCPWEMFGSAPRGTRYMIGVRLVAQATRAIANPEDWSMSFGVEFEPVGALRYLLGIQSWY